MRLVFISDTHGQHDLVKVPPGDILVHAGDLTNDAGQFALRSFCKWLEAQTCSRKVFVAGNHDWAFEKWNRLARLMVKEFCPSATYLEDEGVEIDGVKFWGSPVQPRFLDWAFNRDRGEAIRAHWDMIPEDPDVLVTHGPPYGYLDEVVGRKDGHLGCRDLYEAVLRVQPTLHSFGHIHSPGGRSHKLVHDNGNSTMLINASVVDERYRVVNAPQVFDI